MTQQSDARPAIAAAIIIDAGKVLMVRRRVSEGRLSWQFPAGEVEAGENGEDAAVRETLEEVGLTVGALKTLGERVHPQTGRTMIYVACQVIDGEAHVADADELDQVEWCDHAKLTEYVPYPFYEPVQDYIDAGVK
jgi:8-oxo-dGTP diphosphatase